MTYPRVAATVGVLALAGLASGCAVYPYPVGYADPGVVYAAPAPVLVAPAPVYYGPAYPVFHPSISFHGRFGHGGHRHGHGHGRGHRHR